MTDISHSKQAIDQLEGHWQSRFHRTARIGSATPDCRLERLRAHRNNVRRYRLLLLTRLSDLERALIQSRLAEEVAAMRGLTSVTTPIPAAATDGAAREEA